MKVLRRIEDVKTFIVAGGRWGWVIVKVELDDGSYGVGEASLEGREQSVATAVSELKRSLIGQDPSAISRHLFSLYREPIWSGGPILQCAISGIEMALWDLKGKLLDVPVYELLGGSYRTEVRLYANGWWYQGGTPDDVAAAGKRILDEGYHGIKFNPFNRQPGWEHFYLDSRVLATGLDYVAALREAVGGEAEIFIDLNASFLNVGDALRVIEGLAPFRPAFVEEPLAQENHDALAYLRRRSPLPIASGERLFSLFEFDNLIRSACVDVVQPDLCHCGGISAALKVAALAECSYLPVWPHNPNGPLCEAASAHLATTIPNFGLLEHFPPEPWRREVVGEPYEVKDGFLRLSDKPGFGITFDEDAALARPYESKDLSSFHERNFVGSGR